MSTIAVNRSGRVGVVLVMHGTAGGALVDAVAEVLGSAGRDLDWAVVDHTQAESRAALAGRVAVASAGVDGGVGWLYVSDLVGATPGNVCVDAAALARAAGRPVDVLFGVNLAMLVKLASLDRDHLAPSELVAGALETARRTVRALRDTACGGSAEVLAQASERTRTQ